MLAVLRPKAQWLSCIPQFRNVSAGSAFLKCRRILTQSISRLHPIVRDLATSLVADRPHFLVKASHVEIMREPSQFFKHLLDMISQAQRRILLSSLYIGSARTELIDALRDALQRHPSLQVYIVLDLNRSTRLEPASTVHILSPLLKSFPDRVNISLFRSPKLSGVLAKLIPPRYNEGWGTWHAKIYGADDDVMISGANLNQSYFTNRQDRYIYFRSQPNLAQYCFKFLDTVSSFSFRITPAISSRDGYEIRWTDSRVHPYDIQATAQKALMALNASPIFHTSLSQEVGDDEALVIPIIQAGQFNLREEEQDISRLVHSLLTPPSSASRPLIDLTSGYFALYKPYQDMILNSGLDCRIVAASPKANGFYGSGGISALIPEGYTLLEQRFMHAVNAAGRTWRADNHGVQLSEWSRDGWTYHAKGIWLSPTPQDDPVLSLFGSTNLNSRSANLDFELSFWMLTSSPALRRRLKEEVDALCAFAMPWRGDQRRVRLRTKALVGLVGGML